VTDDPLYRQAIQRFAELLDRARSLPDREPAAILLATADASGRPSARTVLLRAFDDRGFVFFTNEESRKGRQIAVNPRAALCLYRDELQEQAHIEGDVVVATDAESDAYWSSRPRESQLGAWASMQSRLLDRRETFEARIAEFDQRFAGRPVPRPPFWHGYRVVPDRIEFWKGRPFRLHDRELYERGPDGWTLRLLYP
jgi:pyridoxamine 5'-phosphate oxidase